MKRLSMGGNARNMKQKRFWKKNGRGIVLVVLALMIWGVIAVSSASAVLSFERFGHNNYYFYRQLVFAALGILVIFAVSRIDYHLFRSWARPVMLGGLVLLALVLIPSLGFKVGPSRSWFNSGFFFIQPSEFVKLAVIFYLASWFERKKDAETNFWFGILPPVLVTGLAVGLILIQPDPGMAGVYMLIIAAILFAAGARWQYLAGMAGLALAGLWLVIKASPYRAARIITFLDPSLDPQGIGYHINQALLAIGSGGVWGYGFGASRQKHNFLPEPIGDSIFAVMAEELGFARIALMVVLFGVLALLGMRVARSAPDKFGLLAAVGITSWISLQALVNITAISGLLPLTGIPLPFLSYGGSSLLALSLGIGVLLNISKQRV